MTARVIPLSAGAFVAGTSAYVVAGLLPRISAESGVSLGAAGQLSTVFAITYAISAPIATAVTARCERRSVLTGALLLAALGNALTALATTYPLLLLGRVISAAGAAAFTPTATFVATSLFPPERRGRAVALVFGGLTAAIALGVPIGSLLGGVTGFRGVFASIAVAAVVIAFATRLFVPAVAPTETASPKERFAVLGNRVVRRLLLVTTLSVLGAMTIYTYVVPLVAGYTGFRDDAVSALLLVYGCGAVVGNVVGGLMSDRFGPGRSALVLLVASAVAAVSLPLTLTTTAGAALALFAWGCANWAYNPPQQSSLLISAGEQGTFALSLNASAIYLGSGLAGVLGGLVVSGQGIETLPLAGAAVTGLAVVVMTTGRTSSPTPKD
ncbi:MFS transporter [Lentzea sp. NPDC059081]|uniref:MFS transporter n=1 Tax=Lentzea sp. NPDC059081 TaxID=3346719 RepID=UPI00369D447A